MKQHNVCMFQSFQKRSWKAKHTCYLKSIRIFYIDLLSSFSDLNKLHNLTTSSCTLVSSMFMSSTHPAFEDHTFPFNAIFFTLLVKLSLTLRPKWAGARDAFFTQPPLSESLISEQPDNKSTPTLKGIFLSQIKVKHIFSKYNLSYPTQQSCCLN